jgi:hypothetical protein
MSYIFDHMNEYTAEMVCHELDHGNDPIKEAERIARDAMDGFLAAMSEQEQEQIAIDIIKQIASELN